MMRRLIMAFAFAGALALPVAGFAQGSATPAQAGTPSGVPAASPAPQEHPLLSKEADARLRKLSEELRCLVCQNQTLADSNADLAVDLRRQVESMVAKGQSDDQIKDYLVDRYGDFVLYRPPFQWNTLLLWGGPFMLLLVGAAAWLKVQRRSGRRDEQAQQVSASDLERARRLLGD